MKLLYALIGIIAYATFFLVLGLALTGCGGEPTHKDRCEDNARNYYENKGCSFAGKGLGCDDKSETMTVCTGNITCGGADATFTHTCLF